MRTPQSLLSAQVNVVNGHLGPLHDAHPESVHELRIATRRIRELLRILISDSAEAGAELRATLRRLGRELGRVRELDVIGDTLNNVELRLPPTAPVISAARQRLAARQTKARRRMVRAVEDFDMPRLLRRLQHEVTSRQGWHMMPFNRSHAWARTLRQHLAERAGRVEQSVEHGSGVYFAGRAHSLRIAVKKLRYTAEIAKATAVWTPPRLLRDLKRIQARLGEIHDLQVLLEAVPDLTRDAADERGLVDVVRGALEGEIGWQYRMHLQDRDRLKAICRACARQRPSRVFWPRLRSA